MAIGYSPIVSSQRATLGVPDLGAALRSGFETNIKMAEARDKPKSLAEALLNAQLKNKHDQIINQYLPQEKEAGIAHTQAGTGLIGQNTLAQKIKNQFLEERERAELNNLRAPKSMSGETGQLIQLLNTLPSDSPYRKQVEQILSNKAAGTSGTTVFGENGQPLVQIGGTKGGKGSSGGGVYLNQQTGEVTSLPTGSTATNLQGRIIGAENVEPFINEIVEKLPQFQSLPKRGQTYAQGLSNSLLGTNYIAPSELAGGEAAIKEASEGMIKSFGLNATGANRQAMEDILRPRFGESPSGYKNRVNGQLERFVENKELAKRTLRGGVKLNEGEGKGKVVEYARNAQGRFVPVQ